jgi:hypothetical protein
MALDPRSFSIAAMVCHHVRARCSRTPIARHHVTRQGDRIVAVGFKPTLRYASYLVCRHAGRIAGHGRRRLCASPRSPRCPFPRCASREW